jgi:hypothetical protein
MSSAISHQEPTEAPSKILTVEGWLSLEDDYLPRVCAESIATRTPKRRRRSLVIAEPEGACV